MSGHSHPSGGPSQRLDTRRSQIRGIVDEPQSCRLKVRIIETQRQRERAQYTENQKERDRDRKKNREGDPQIESSKENQRKAHNMEWGKETRRQKFRRWTQSQKQRCKASQSRGTPVPTHSHRETQRQTMKDRGTGTQGGSRIPWTDTNPQRRECKERGRLRRRGNRNVLRQNGGSSDLGRSESGGRCWPPSP